MDNQVQELEDLYRELEETKALIATPGLAETQGYLLETQASQTLRRIEDLVGTPGGPSHPPLKHVIRWIDNVHLPRTLREPEAYLAIAVYNSKTVPILNAYTLKPVGDATLTVGAAMEWDPGAVFMHSDSTLYGTALDWPGYFNCQHYQLFWADGTVHIRYIHHEEIVAQQRYDAQGNR